jgi:hypothetical protein
MTYGVGFAALTATIVHVALFHGRYVFCLYLLSNNINMFNVLKTESEIDPVNHLDHNPGGSTTVEIG